MKTGRRSYAFALLLLCFLFSAMPAAGADGLAGAGVSSQHSKVENMSKLPDNLSCAVFAGGCFWGMQQLFRQLDGVKKTTVGYTGGDTDNPTYNDVKTGRTGHAEAVEIIFDPAIISYRELLEFFFQIHNPTTQNQQGNDIGTQYRSAIFYVDDAQKQAASEVMAAVDESGKWPGKLATQLQPATRFYDAEKYHQDYLQNNPGGYSCHFIRPKWKL